MPFGGKESNLTRLLPLGKRVSITPSPKSMLPLQAPNFEYIVALNGITLSVSRFGLAAEQSGSANPKSRSTLFFSASVFRSCHAAVKRNVDCDHCHVQERRVWVEGSFQWRRLAPSYLWLERHLASNVGHVKQVLEGALLHGSSNVFTEDVLNLVVANDERTLETLEQCVDDPKQKHGESAGQEILRLVLFGSENDKCRKHRDRPALDSHEHSVVRPYVLLEQVNLLPEELDLIVKCVFHLYPTPNSDWTARLDVG